MSGAKEVSIEWFAHGQKPYVGLDVECGWVHARVLGSKDGLFYVEYPTDVFDRYTYGPLTRQWVSASSVRRIRRADSRWADLDDDLRWHEATDLVIQDTEIKSL